MKWKETPNQKFTVTSWSPEFKVLLRGNGLQPGKKWLKTHEVRKMLNISSGKLLTLRINGTLPYTKIGGVIYYDQEDIQQMFSSRKFQHP